MTNYGYGDGAGWDSEEEYENCWQAFAATASESKLAAYERDLRRIEEKWQREVKEYLEKNKK